MAGDSSDVISQQELFESVRLIRNLNVASLTCDYLFVFAAITVAALFYLRQDTADKDLQQAIRWTVPVTVMGSLVDIVLTFAVVHVIRVNGLTTFFDELYEENCYSDSIDRTILDLQSEFSTILVLNVTEGALDLFCLIILAIGYFAWRETVMEEVTQGIHDFIFGVFDLIVITINVAMFVLPTYEVFVAAYNDDESLCYSITYT